MRQLDDFGAAFRYGVLRAQRKLAKAKRQVLATAASCRLPGREWWGNRRSASNRQPATSRRCGRALEPRVWPPIDRDSLTSAFLELFPEAREAILEEADNVCNHSFALFGSVRTQYRPADDIDWHLDPRSGYRWSARAYYTTIDLSPAEDGRDVRVAWELNRFHHAVTLAKAYCLTRDKRYAREFAHQLRDWVNSNPVNYGVNWTCAMEAAIRAVNLAVAYCLLRRAEDGAMSTGEAAFGEIAELLGTTLRQHAAFILDNLEFSRPSGNHFLFDAAGLVILGIVFPELRGARRWVRRGTSILWRELGRQFGADGANFEGSTAYHALVCELYLTVMGFCELGDVEMPDHVKAGIERACEFLLSCLKPDGSIVRFGDDDDGRLLVFSERERRTKAWYRSLLVIAAVMFRRPDFQAAAGPFTESALWFLGPEGMRRYERLAAPPREALGSGRLESKGFVQSGYYFMRHGELLMAVDGADIGMKGTGGHGHNDLLSFEVTAGDDTLIADPGTFVYSADEEARNRFRGTAAHNTFSVDEREVAEFIPGKLWSVANAPRVQVDRWLTTGSYDVFDAQHDGYEALAEPVRHRRQICFEKAGGVAGGWVGGFWLVRDSFTGRGRHTFRLNIHFGLTRAALWADVPGAVMAWAPGKAAFDVLLIPVSPAAGAVGTTLLETWLSPRYGEKRPAPTACFCFEAAAPAEFAFLIVPFRAVGTAPSQGALQDLLRRAAARRAAFPNR